MENRYRITKFLSFCRNLIESFTKTSKILAKRNYSKIFLILLDHDSSSSRPFITWTNEKKSVYMELKNIFSLIPIHFLNKLGLYISRCPSETKMQMLNDLTIKSGLKKGNLSGWFLVIMFLLQEERQEFICYLYYYKE